MHRSVVCFSAFAITLGAAAGAALAKDPLSELMGSAVGDTACFTRTYTPAHLAQHPKQRIEQVDVAFFVGSSGPDTGRWFWIGFREKGKTDAQMVYGTGGCDYREVYGKDANGRPRKEWQGDGCFTSDSHANEDKNGRPQDTKIELSKDGRSITVRTDTYMPVLSGWPDDPKRERLNLGAEDRVFKLELTEPSFCFGRNGVAKLND